MRETPIRYVEDDPDTAPLYEVLFRSALGLIAFGVLLGYLVWGLRG